MMVEIPRRQQLLACHNYVTKLSIELFNVVSSASGKATKNRQQRVQKARYLLSSIGTLNCLVDNSSVGLRNVGELFIGNAPVVLCGRHAASWHSWVVNTANTIVLAVLNMLNVKFSLGNEDEIVIPDMPTPSSDAVDLAELCRKILQSEWNNELPLTEGDLDSLDASLPVELENALRRITETPMAAIITANDARGRFAYEEWFKGTAWNKIRDEINREPDWVSIWTDNGVKDAAKRYAKKNNTARAAFRHAGRPPKNTKRNTK